MLPLPQMLLKCSLVDSLKAFSLFKISSLKSGGVPILFFKATTSIVDRFLFFFSIFQPVCLEGTGIKMDQICSGNNC